MHGTNRLVTVFILAGLKFDRCSEKDEMWHPNDL